MAPSSDRKKGSASSGPMKQGSLFSFFNKKAGSSSSNGTSRATANNKVANSNKSSNNKPPSSTNKKTPSKASSSSSSKQSPSASTPPSSARSSKKTKTVDPNIPTVDERVEIWWPDDECYYAGTVVEADRANPSRIQVIYDIDGESEWVDLAQHKFRRVQEKKKASTSQERRKSSRNQSHPNKRRVITEEDDDEEKEFGEAFPEKEDNDDDEESAYEETGDANDKDDDQLEDEDDWMVSDEEEEEESPSQRRRQRPSSSSSKNSKGRLQKRQSKASSEDEKDEESPRLKRRRLDDSESGSAPTTSLAAFAHSCNAKRTPPKSTDGSASLDKNSLSNPRRITPGDNSATRKPPVHNDSNDKSPNTTAISPPSTASSKPSKTPPSKTKPTKNPPMFIKNALNPAGSHLHHHLPFLQNPRDSQGRTPDHPHYDPRTLQVVHSQWEKLNGSAMTHAVKQWWDLKAQYFDTVLFFKTGKFYELYHMDADVGVTHLNLNHMKGHVAHSGFPEIAYGYMSHKLVQLGFKVARVEQTETPEQLEARKKQIKGRKTPKPKVVNREVCSIMTLGTRTFCHLDDPKGLATEVDGTGSATRVGPLLAICQVNVEDDSAMQDDCDNEGDDNLKPVCEYGICLVDALRGTLALGQFADNVLRNRLQTLLATFQPSEILWSGEHEQTNLESMLKAYQTDPSFPTCRIEVVRPSESFPPSTALDPAIRKQLQRPTTRVRPWDTDETLLELHRRAYYPRASRKQQQPKDPRKGISRWPPVLQAVVEGGADLCLASVGATLYYLQRNLIDEEIFSMGLVRAYVPSSPEESNSNVEQEEQQSRPTQQLERLAQREERQEEAVELPSPPTDVSSGPVDNDGGMEEDGSCSLIPSDMSLTQSVLAEASVNHMALDGTTLHNLEILANATDHKVAGSLWGLLTSAKTSHGSRLLRAWLLRPLFRKADIDRRADAVQELASGAAALACQQVRNSILNRCGDMERLLSRVHTMSGASSNADDDQNETRAHPNERAVLYEAATYTKRKVGDFSKILNSLQVATQIPEAFEGVELESGLLAKVVRYSDQGGCFPRITEQLDWFFENFDCESASKGLFEPSRGVDTQYDEACDKIKEIETELMDYRDEMVGILKPSALARSSWKYINTKPESKDKYLIELPNSIQAPRDFIMKGKRGSGAKQVNKYRTPVVEALVQALEQALEVQRQRKARGMQLIFAKFDSLRDLWSAAAKATALLDALCALAQTASKAGYTRPNILDCPPDGNPSITIVQGRHPCVEASSVTDFIPNDLILGEADGAVKDRVLLLSGPNLGGKSTLLRQTCLICILAQIGAFVPADECSITPVDRIYTRLGASDRILLGQSTFFVELAETATALRGATRRSLVIMDELGRGTSTFDGTAIASATIKHLVERNQCLCLFATHYHSLLEEWKSHPMVRLGHMECVVESDEDESHSDGEECKPKRVTFLYTLGEGVCPKSFGINVARLAGLPEEVLRKAQKISADFENDMHSYTSNRITLEEAEAMQKQIMEAMEAKDWEKVKSIWGKLQIQGGMELSN